MRPVRIAAACAAVAAIAGFTAFGTDSSPTASAAVSAVPRYDHVVLVLFENKNYTSIKGSSSAP